MASPERENPLGPIARPEKWSDWPQDQLDELLALAVCRVSQNCEDRAVVTAVRLEEGCSVVQAAFTIRVPHETFTLGYRDGADLVQRSICEALWNAIGPLLTDSRINRLRADYLENLNRLHGGVYRYVDGRLMDDKGKDLCGRR